MNTICFFASYFTQDEMPYYMRYYLLDLKKHFSELVFLYSNNNLNEAGLEFLKQNSIKPQYELNEGFDFGMWKKALDKTDVTKFDRVAFVNDSCVLFKPLDSFFQYTNSKKHDVYGMSESTAVSYHLQSYFLVFEKKAIPFVKEYLALKGIQQNIQDVIKHYEIGLSTFLLQKGCSLNAYMNNKNYSGEFSPYYILLEDFIKQGVPVIKKKIMYSSYRKSELNTLARMNFTIHPFYYIDLIKQHCASAPLIDFEKLLTDQKNEMSTLSRFSYAMKRELYAIGRPLYKLVKGKRA
jgi:lipopolysaccharide biosynthesis protein